MLSSNDEQKFISLLNLHGQLEVFDRKAQDIFTISNTDDPKDFDFNGLAEYLRQEGFLCDKMNWKKLLNEFLGDEFRLLMDRIGAAHLEIARKHGKVYAISVSSQDFLVDLEAIWVQGVVRDAVGESLMMQETNLLNN